MLAVVAVRLGEAMVEEAQPAAGDVRHQAVEDDAALRVLVEALIEKVPQKSAALRHAERERAVDRRLAVRRSQRILVAARRAAETKSDRARRRSRRPARSSLPPSQISSYRTPGSKPPAISSRISGTCPARRLRLALRQPHQLPLVARHDYALVLFVHSPGEHAFVFALRGRRIGAVIGPARERHRLDVGCRCSSPGGRCRVTSLPVFAGLRRLQEQPAVAGQQFADPAGPDDGVALRMRNPSPAGFLASGPDRQAGD